MKNFLKYFYFNFVYLFIILSLLNYSIYPIFTKSNANNNSLVQYKFDQFSGVYFASVLVAEYNLSRIYTSYRTYGNSIQYYSKNSRFEVYSKIKVPPWRNKTRKYKQHHPFNIIDLLFGWHQAMIDFIYQTDLPWFLRTTDDVFIYLPNFAKLINLLETIYDPYKDNVLKGHLCEYFIHGGSGWLLSRHAVQKIMKKYPTLDNFNLSNYGDDVQASFIFEELNIPIFRWNNKAFLGSPATTESLQSFSTGDYSKLSVCDKPIMTRIKDIAVWHCGNQNMECAVHGKEYIENIPENIYAVTDYHGSFDLCKYDNFIQSPIFNDIYEL